MGCSTNSGAALDSAAPANSRRQPERSGRPAGAAGRRPPRSCRLIATAAPKRRTMKPSAWRPQSAKREWRTMDPGAGRPRFAGSTPMMGASPEFVPPGRGPSAPGDGTEPVIMGDTTVSTAAEYAAKIAADQEGGEADGAGKCPRKPCQAGDRGAFCDFRRVGELPVPWSARTVPLAKSGHGVLPDEFDIRW